jgi:hypothetical protein
MKSDPVPLCWIGFGMVIIGLVLPWLRHARWPVLPILLGVALVVRGVWMALSDRAR